MRTVGGSNKRSVVTYESPLNTRSLVWVKCDLVGSLVQEEHNAYHA